MEIRLQQMPFKFQTPDGLMEVTVRSDNRETAPGTQHHFTAAATFIGAGPRALERIQLTPNAKSHSEVMKTLLTGFKVTPSSHESDTINHRVLTALITAPGVIDLDS
jgi:hypothetical protein